MPNGDCVITQTRHFLAGSIDNWVLEGHKLEQKVAYGDLASGDPVVIGPRLRKASGPVIELQLEKAGVRLAYVLNEGLK